jgi:hypothetical protein
MFSSLVSGLIGALIGGAISAWSTAAGVRRSLEAQLGLQRGEWEKRDGERDQERRDREIKETEERERCGTEGVRALAAEALWNSTFLLTVAKKVQQNSSDPVPHIRLSRGQFDKNFLLSMQRLKGFYLQQTVNTYLSGFSLQESREGRKALPVGALELKAIGELSDSFLIVFRSLGHHVCLPQELQEFEMTRNVVQAQK